MLSKSFFNHLSFIIYFDFFVFLSFLCIFSVFSKTLILHPNYWSKSTRKNNSQTHPLKLATYTQLQPRKFLHKKHRLWDSSLLTDLKLRSCLSSGAPATIKRIFECFNSKTLSRQIKWPRISEFKWPVRWIFVMSRQG